MASNIDKKLVEKEVGSKIKEERDEGFDVMSFEFKNGQEFLVFSSYDDAENYATRKVEEDLDSEPELFSQDWLEGFIDTERLSRDLDDDVYNQNHSYYTEIADEDGDEYETRQIDELIEGDFLDKDDVEDESKIDLAVEDAARDRTDEQLRNPMEYLREIYGDEDAIKEAMRIAGFDTRAAAENAIQTDGVAHFLSSYDGEEVELDNGNVMYRLN